MSEETVKRIGLLITGEAERDAIHIAVYPAIAAGALDAGMSVTIADGKAYHCSHPSRIGIVDPFLTGRIYEGERCWIFLNPGSITGLRHDWTHPALSTAAPTIADKRSHEDWIRAFASRWDMDYDELIEAAMKESKEDWDNFVTAHGTDLHGSTELGGDHDLFWLHLEILTGKTFDEGHRQRFGWSCSC